MARSSHYFYVVKNNYIFTYLTNNQKYAIIVGEAIYLKLKFGGEIYGRLHRGW